MRIYVEDWQVEYGRPNLVADDEDTVEGSATLVEDGDGRLARHEGQAPAPERLSLACVDGVRRAEALLVLPEDSAGDLAHGIAGSLAYGSVLIEGERRPEFGPCQVERLAIWGSSRKDAALLLLEDQPCRAIRRLRTGAPPWGSLSSRGHVNLT